MSRAGALGLALVAASVVALPSCTFDSTVDGIPQIGQQVVILDAAPSSADCELRSREMAWIIHSRDAEAAPAFGGLPLNVEATTTPNGTQCEYFGSVQARIHPDLLTSSRFVLAMDESGWVAECFTPLFEEGGEGAPVSVGPITFTRGEPGCEVG